MVERQLPKLNVAGSNPVSRSNEKSLDFVDVSTISGFFLFENLTAQMHKDVPPYDILREKSYQTAVSQPAGRCVIHRR